MLVFTSIDSIHDARLAPHLAAYIQKLFASMLKEIPSYNPEEDGYLALVRPGDSDESMEQRLGYSGAGGRWFKSSHPDQKSRGYGVSVAP